MNKKGYSAVELIIVLAVFSVGYFVATWVISGKIGVNFADLLYEEKISAIEKQASIYAMNDLSLFEENKTTYVTVGDLVDKNVVISNSDGKVVDPRSEDNVLNDVKIKLTKKDDKVEAKVLN